MGLAGSAIAAKSAFGGNFLGGGSGGNQISQGYGPSYGYNSGSSYGNSYGYNPAPTTATYYTSQTYVPQTYAPPQTYASPQPSYIQPPSVYGPPQPSFNPINSALAWKAGLASNLASSIGFNQNQNQIQSAPAYAYGAPPVQYGAPPNKPVYVACDN